MPAPRTTNSEERTEVFARLFAPVDKARAVFRGVMVVGHRRSVEVGEMVWALPGRSWAYGADLEKADPGFTVVAAPGRDTLQNNQLRYLNLLPRSTARV